jgi:polyphosphate kinase 2 (PPK2 family)
MAKEPFSALMETTVKGGQEVRNRAEAGQQGELKRKDYERQLAKLHVELVKLQEWIKQAGKKVCIVFEGRDGAGKGGTIKAITERVSPRVFRVVALPAPTEREKSQMYIQRYIPYLRGWRSGDLRPQLV